MLCVRAVSGDEILSAKAEEFSDIRALKEHLCGLTGTSRFRQKIILDGSVVEPGATVLPGQYQMVSLPHESSADTSAEEQQAFLAAASEGAVEAVEILLCKPLDPDLEVPVEDEDPITGLCAASRAGMVDVVHLLLEARADPNKNPEGCNTPLCHAAANGHKEVVRVLLDAGADVDKGGEDENAPLCHAAFKGDEAIARLLLEARADVDKEGFDIDGCTPLVAAAHRDHDAIVELLIAARADVDKQPDWYNSALSYASRGGSDGMLRMLLEAGADPEREDCKSLVMRGEYEEAMRLLKEAAAEEKARMAA